MSQIDLTRIPDGWIRTTLGEIFKWGSGGTPKRDNPAYYGGDIPWLIIGDLNDGIVRTATTYITEQGLASSSAKWIEPGSILIAMYGSIGKLGISGTRLTTNQAIAFTKPDPIEPRFLFWYLRAQRDALISEGKGGTQQNISQTVIKAFPFVLAPLPEQHRIVEEIEKQFTRLDAAVESLERARGNLKRYRASVLAAASEGRLVPTEAELARQEMERDPRRGEPCVRPVTDGHVNQGEDGIQDHDQGDEEQGEWDERQGEHKVRPYEPATTLLDRILAERRVRWEAAELAKMQANGKPPRSDAWKSRYKEPTPPDTTGLPELPEGWVWTTWDQVGTSQNGRAFPSKEYSESGIRLLRPGNLHESGKIEWNSKNTRHMPDEWAELYPQYILGERELVMNLTAQSLEDEFLGRICLTPPGERCLLNQRIARLKPIKVIPEYLLYMFKSRVFRKFVNGLNTGSLIQHMFTSQLAEFILPLPPLAEQQRIVEEVERRLSLVEEMERAVEANLQRAGRLRQAILKRAFEGCLVPQNPTDEPASALLERIRAEREQTGNRGQQKLPIGSE